jgi:hypothetical protein
MDQPAIYSETLCKRIVLRNGESAMGRVGDGKPQAGPKTGAGHLKKEQHDRRAEFFALPMCVIRSRCWLY